MTKADGAAAADFSSLRMALSAAEVQARLVDPKSLPEAVQRQRVRAWTAIKSGR